jgi:hypothetical protein
VSDERVRAGVAVGGGAVVPLKRGTEDAALPVIGEEQLVYARWLDGGMKIGLLVLTATFALYMTGVLAPHIAVEELPQYWAMPVKDYLAATGIHAGWSWVGMIGKGDFLNFVGIAFLAGITIACYVVIIPIFLRKNDRVFAALAVLEVLVLVLAASGLLKSGGH